jgi:hypothetical protein
MELRQLRLAIGTILFFNFQHGTFTAWFSVAGFHFLFDLSAGKVFRWKPILFSMKLSVHFYQTIKIREWQLGDCLLIQNLSPTGGGQLANAEKS